MDELEKQARLHELLKLELWIELWIDENFHQPSCLNFKQYIDARRDKIEQGVEE